MCEHRKLFFSRKLREESKTLCEELAETLKAMGWLATADVDEHAMSFLTVQTDHTPDLTMPEEQ